MTPTQVLKRIQVLKDWYRRQGFSFKPEQREEMDNLWMMRKERVRELLASQK